LIADTASETPADGRSGQIAAAGLGVPEPVVFAIGPWATTAGRDEELADRDTDDLLLRRSFTSRIARTSKPESFGPAGSRSPPRREPVLCRGVTWRVRTQDPEGAEVTAYQDGVGLGRAIVPVDAIAPGEAPPEWNLVVRFVGSCAVRVAAGTRRGVAEVEPAGAS
jgi:hypothetical protein